MKRICISGLTAFLVLIASSAFAQFGGNSASTQTVRVTADRANLRDKPAADGAIVSSVSKGDELDVLDQAGSWYHVRAKSTGAQGYISSLLAEVVSAAPSGGAPAAPRQAPAPTLRSGTPETPPAAPRPAAAQPPAAPAQSAGAAPAAERAYFIRAFGGLFSGSGMAGGGGLGGGVAAKPFGDDRFEIQGDLSYTRQSLNAFTYLGSAVTGSDLVGIHDRVLTGSGNLLYNFHLANQGFTPFVGAGLAYSNSSFSLSGQYAGFTAADMAEFASAMNALNIGWSGLSLQAIGGIEKPLNDRMAIRAELRTGGQGLLLLGGVSF